MDDTTDSCSTERLEQQIDIKEEHKDNNCNDRILYDPSASIFQNFGEVVCVGATAIIILLLLCILLFFEIKDHDDDS